MYGGTTYGGTTYGGTALVATPPAEVVDTGSAVETVSAGCVDASFMQGLMTGFIQELGTRIDVYQGKTSTYDPVTGVFTQPSFPHLDVVALELTGAQVMTGSDFQTDRDQRTFIVPAQGLGFIPSVNDSFESPAASLRGSGDYARYTVRRVDRMAVGSTVIQYALVGISG